MCGFLGCLNGKLATARKMVNLNHRGPDATDKYETENLYILHHRLAIIGEEETAHQPMKSHDGTVVIAFNGEIYNYLEIADWMGQPKLAEDGDTRVLVELLATYGIKHLSMLNGMFSIVAYWPASGELYLIRDRFGIKPLYYSMLNDGVYFASEIKSLQSLIPKSFSSHHLQRYIDYGLYPSGKETFFDGIYQVEAGTWLKYSNGTQTEHRYYNLQAECQQSIKDKPSVEDYESLLEDAIRLRLRSDVPISLHYSGGTDSTALLLKTKDVWGWDFPITAFSMAFDEDEFDESRFAESYCSQIGVKHKKVTLSANEVPDLAEQLNYFEDEPFGGIPTIAYYKLNKVERNEGYIVSIEGQGGDETFGGYLYHAYLAMYDLAQSGKNSNLLNVLLQKYDVKLTQVIKTAENLIASGFISHTDLTNMADSTSPELKPEMFKNWLMSVQIYDILTNKIPRTLRFNDRASMACSREVRFPMLDHRVLSCGLALTHKQKYLDGFSKAPLRSIIRRHLLGAYAVPKRSVVTPQTNWLQSELKSWALERIDHLKRSALLPNESFDQVDIFYQNKNAANSFRIWQLINLSFMIDP